MKEPPEILGGPYEPPRVARNDWLDDEIDGAVQVGRWSDGRISWPCRKKTGTRSLILCGDLVKAVKTESALAVMYLFGVGFVTVAKWRKALGVDYQNNAGTQKLYHDLLPIKISPEAAAEGRRNAATPEAIAKISASKRGKPLSASHRANIMAAWFRRKETTTKTKVKKPESAKRAPKKKPPYKDFTRRIELYNAGVPSREIARIEGVTPDRIYAWAREQGLRREQKKKEPAPRKKPGCPPKDFSNRREMFEAGKSAEEIARAEGKSTVTIHNWAHKNGLVFNLFRRRYERRREMLEAGASIAEIARAEGVTIQAIYTWIKTK